MFRLTYFSLLWISSNGFNLPHTYKKKSNLRCAKIYIISKRTSSTRTFISFAPHNCGFNSPVVLILTQLGLIDGVFLWFMLWWRLSAKWSLLYRMLTIMYCVKSYFGSHRLGYLYLNRILYLDTKNFTKFILKKNLA